MFTAQPGFYWGMWKHFVIFALLCATPASAEERKLDGAAIKSILSEVTLTGTDPDKQIEQVFRDGGLTLYRENGQQSQGFWRIESDKYCSQWPPGQHWECYEMFQEGEFVTFVSSSGNLTRMKLPPAK